MYDFIKKYCEPSPPPPLTCNCGRLIEEENLAETEALLCRECLKIVHLGNLSESNNAIKSVFPTDPSIEFSLFGEPNKRIGPEFDIPPVEFSDWLNPGVKYSLHIGFNRKPSLSYYDKRKDPEAINRYYNPFFK